MNLRPEVQREKKYFLIEAQWIYSAVFISVYSKVSQLYLYLYILFHILFLYCLSQETEYSSLCNTVEPCLPILYTTLEKLS